MTSPNPYAIDADTLSGMLPLRKVVFALGSNLGDRQDNLQSGLNAITDTPDLIVVDVSPIYETRPVGCPEGSPDFLNAVVVAEAALGERRLMERVSAIESAYDRDRTEPNAPRRLDVDLIVLGSERSDTDELTLPHPRAHERAFVLAPWVDIDPDAELPGRGRAADLLESLDRSGLVVREDLTLER